jgi:hypothetical protein
MSNYPMPPTEQDELELDEDSSDRQQEEPVLQSRMSRERPLPNGLASAGRRPLFRQ